MKHYFELKSGGDLTEKPVEYMVQGVWNELKDGKQQAGERLLLDQYFLTYLAMEAEKDSPFPMIALENFFGSQRLRMCEVERRRQQVQKNLKNMYFVLHKPGHWVLVHVRRRPRSNGEIWVLDSLQGPASPIVPKLKKFLVWLTGEEYDQNDQNLEHV